MRRPAREAGHTDAPRRRGVTRQQHGVTRRPRWGCAALLACAAVLPALCSPNSAAAAGSQQPRRCAADTVDFFCVPADLAEQWEADSAPAHNEGFGTLGYKIPGVRMIGRATLATRQDYLPSAGANVTARFVVQVTDEGDMAREFTFCTRADAQRSSSYSGVSPNDVSSNSMWVRGGACLHFTYCPKLIICGAEGWAMRLIFNGNMQSCGASDLVHITPGLEQVWEVTIADDGLNVKGTVSLQYGLNASHVEKQCPSSNGLGRNKVAAFGEYLSSSDPQRSLRLKFASVTQACPPLSGVLSQRRTKMAYPCSEPLYVSNSAPWVARASLGGAQYAHIRKDFFMSTAISAPNKPNLFLTMVHISRVAKASPTNLNEGGNALAESVRMQIAIENCHGSPVFTESSNPHMGSGVRSHPMSLHAIFECGAASANSTRARIIADFATGSSDPSSRLQATSMSQFAAGGTGAVVLPGHSDSIGANGMGAGETIVTVLRVHSGHVAWAHGDVCVGNDLCEESGSAELAFTSSFSDALAVMQGNSLTLSTTTGAPNLLLLFDSPNLFLTTDSRPCVTFGAFVDGEVKSQKSVCMTFAVKDFDPKFKFHNFRMIALVSGLSVGEKTIELKYKTECEFGPDWWKCPVDSNPSIQMHGPWRFSAIALSDQETVSTVIAAGDATCADTCERASTWRRIPGLDTLNVSVTSPRELVLIADVGWVETCEADGSIGLRIVRIAHGQMVDVVAQTYFWGYQGRKPPLSRTQVWQGTSHVDAGHHIFAIEFLTNTHDSGVGVRFCTAELQVEHKLVALTMPDFAVTSLDPGKLPEFAASDETQSVSVLGFNFGTEQRCMAMRMGSTSCVSTVWTSDSSLLCQAAAGASSKAAAVLSVDGLGIKTKVAAFDYAQPIITQSSNSPAISDGRIVQLQGSSFGVHDYSPTAALAYTVCARTVWIAATSINYVSPSGVGAPSILLNVSNYVSNPSASHSFDLPVATAVHPKGGVMSGYFSLTLLGTNFGAADYTLSASLGSSKCLVATWTSDSAISCLAAPGSGTVGVMPSSFLGEDTSSNSQDDCGVGCLSMAFTYNGPEVTSLQWQYAVTPDWITWMGRTNGPVAQETTISIYGDNFGPVAHTDVSGRVGSTACVATTWVSNTRLTCRVAPGLLQEHDVTAMVHGQNGTLEGAFSYDTVSVRIEGAFVNPGFNGPAAPSSLVSLQGINFGNSDYSPVVALQETACAVTSWVSDSSVNFKTPGVLSYGHDLFLNYSNSATYTLALEFQFSIDLPEVLRPGTSNVFAGMQTLNMSGVNFGTFDATVKVNIHGSGCEATRWESDALVKCKVPAGAGAWKAITTTVALQKSKNTAIVNFDKPSISSIFPGNGFPGSQGVITFWGQNFGTVDYSPEAFVGPNKCRKTIWINETMVTCKIPLGLEVGADVKLKVPEESYQALITAAFTYDGLIPAGAEVTSSWRSNGPARGQGLIVLTGTFRAPTALLLPDDETPCQKRWPPELPGSAKCPYMEHKDVIYEVFVGHGRRDMTACLSTEWMSETTLICTTNPGIGGGHALIVRSGVPEHVPNHEIMLAYGIFLNVYSYDSPSVTESTENIDNHSPRSIGIAGANFGVFDTSPKSRLALTAAESTEWVNDISLAGKAASGVGSMPSLVLTISGARANSSKVYTYSPSFRYDLSTSSSVVGSNSPPSATNVAVTLAGRNFGQADYSATVTFGHTLTPSSTWISDTSFVALVPQGVGSAISLTHSLDASGTPQSVLHHTISYDVPLATDIVKDVPYPPFGGSHLSITGANFGVVDYSARGWVGDTECASTVWKADSSLLCITPAGTHHGKGPRLPLAVEVADQKVFNQNISTLFRYDRFGAVGFSASCSDCVDIGSSTQVVYNTFDFPFLEQPVIEAIDPFGSRVPYYDAMVTVNLVHAGSVDTLLQLSGTTVRPVADGLVHFTDLYINGTYARGRYRLKFSAANMTTLYGGLFDILKVDCSSAMAGFTPEMFDVLGNEILIVRLSNFYPIEDGTFSFYFEEMLPSDEARAPKRIKGELVRSDVDDTSPVVRQTSYYVRTPAWAHYPVTQVLIDATSVPCFQAYFIDYSRPRVMSVSPAVSSTDGGVPITLNFIDRARAYSFAQVSGFQVEILDGSGSVVAGGGEKVSLQSQLPDGSYGLVFKTPSVTQPGYYNLKLLTGDSLLVCCEFPWYGPQKGFRLFFEVPPAQIEPKNVIPHVTASKVELQLFFFKFKYKLSSSSDVSDIISRCRLFGNGAPWEWDTTDAAVSVPEKGGAKVSAILPDSIASAGSRAYPLGVSLAIDCSGAGFLSAVNTGANLFIYKTPSVNMNNTTPKRIEVYGGSISMQINYFPYPLQADLVNVVLKMPSGEEVPPVQFGITTQSAQSTILLIELPHSLQAMVPVPGQVLIRAEPQQGPENIPLSDLTATGQIAYFQPDPVISRVSPSAAAMNAQLDVAVILTKIAPVVDASELDVSLVEPGQAIGQAIEPRILQSDFLSTVFTFKTPLRNQAGVVWLEVAHMDEPSKIGSSPFTFTKMGMKAVCRSFERFPGAASIAVLESETCSASTDGSTSFEIVLEGFDVANFESEGVVELAGKKMEFKTVGSTPFVIKVGIPPMNEDAVLRDASGCFKPLVAESLKIYDKSNTLNLAMMKFHYHTPPCLSNVAFVGSGSYILGEFNQITDQGGMGPSDSVPCAELVTVDGTNSSRYWGEGGACFWVSPVRLRMNIGVGEALIVPGQVISVAPSATILSVPSFPTKATGSNFVNLPTALLSPSARISGPTMVGPCPLDEIRLKGQATSPREVTYIWSCSNNQQLNTMLTAESGADILIDSTLLNPGIEYIIQLQVVDFLGSISDVVSHHLVQNPNLIPRVKIEGSPPFLASQKCYFIAIVRFSACQQEQLAIQFDWIVHERDSMEVVYSSNTPSLEIPKGTLSPSTSYVVSLEAGGVGKEAGSASFEFETGVSELVASIALGDRMHPRSQLLVLDAGSSHDLDFCNVDSRTGGVFALGDPCFVDITGEVECSRECTDASMSFQWKCTVDGLDCRLQDWSLLEIDDDGSVSLDVSDVRIDPPTLPLVFSVRVQKGNRAKSTSIRITVVDLTAVPYLDILVQFSRKADGDGRPVINPTDRLLVAAETDACELVDCELYADAVQFKYAMFEMVQGEESSRQVLTSDDLAKIPTGLSTQQLIVNPGVLLPGKHYSVKLTLSDRVGTVLGLSGLVVVLNEPPSGGTCAVTPSTGIELQDDFTVQCSRWMDDNLPLSYIFGFEAPDVPPSIFPPVKTPAQLSDSYSMKLPGGKIQIRCTVLDALECRAAPFKISLDVSPVEAGENVLDTVNQMTETAAKLGDVSALLQSGDASAGQCGDLGADSGRRNGAQRHLLASSAAYRMRMRRMLLRKMSGSKDAVDGNSGVSALSSSARLSAKPDQVVPSVGDPDSSAVEGTASLMSASSNILTVEQLLGADNAAQSALSTAASVVDGILRLPRSMRTASLQTVVSSAIYIQRVIGRSMSVHEPRKKWVFDNLCTTVERLEYSRQTFTVEGAKAGANVTVTIADEAVEKVRFHPMIVQTIYVAVPWEESFRLWDRGSARPISSIFGAEMIVPETSPRKRAYWKRRIRDWTPTPNYTNDDSDRDPVNVNDHSLRFGTSIRYPTTWHRYLRKRLHDGRTTRYVRRASKDQRRALLSEYGGNVKVKGILYTVNIPLNLQELSTNRTATVEIFQNPFECIECLRWRGDLGDYARDGCKLNGIDRAGSSVQCTCDTLGFVIAVYTPLEIPMVVGASVWSKTIYFIHLRALIMVMVAGIAVVGAQCFVERNWHKRIHEDSAILAHNFRDWVAFTEATPLHGNISGWFGGQAPKPDLELRYFSEGNVISEKPVLQSTLSLLVPRSLTHAISFVSREVKSVSKSGASVRDLIASSSSQISGSFRTLGHRRQNDIQIQNGEIILFFGPDLFEEMSGPYTAKMSTFLQRLHDDISLELGLWENRSMLKILPPARDDDNCALFLVRFSTTPDRDPNLPNTLAQNLYNKWNKMNSIEGYEKVHAAIVPHLCRVQDMRPNTGAARVARNKQVSDQDGANVRVETGNSSPTPVRKEKIEVDPHSASMPPFVGLAKADPETPREMWQAAQVPPRHPLLNDDRARQSAVQSKEVGADFTGVVPVSMRGVSLSSSRPNSALYISSPADAVLADENMNETYMAAMREYLGDLDI